ncbi:DEAD/DEAH box helicase [Brevibacillus daliensis]|uniref:DEAD/DEAH box helicase n=1 Tax=Brevibacillus daliensis TaxID=2892995 RepID=UPI001E49C77A|nr:DEAD/DEAH box helicase [Brevibacillus daliensis]
MTTLHGIWLPDAFFLFCLQGGEVVPVSLWIDQLDDEERRLISTASKVGTRSFQVPYWFDQGEFYPSNKPKLMSAQISGLLVPLADALPFLLKTNMDHSISSQVFASDTLRYWQKASMFALYLLEHSRFKPSVALVKGKRYGYSEATAYWDVDLSREEEKNQFNHLASSMPAISRAYDPLKTGNEMNTDPFNILHEFLLQSIEVTFIKWLYKETGEYARLLQKKRLDTPLQWLQGLLVKNTASIEGLTKELQGFKQHIDKWTRGELRNERDFVGHIPMRLFLQLQPPAMENLTELQLPEAEWLLHICLQPITDPGHYINARDIWLGTDSAAQYFGSLLPRAQFFLLEQLGKASLYVPQLADELAKELPWQLSMTSSEAFYFLKELVPSLQTAGFGIQLPSWWMQKSRKSLGIKLRVKDWKAISDSKQSGDVTRFGFEELLQFDVRAALGNQEISMDDLKKIATSQSPLVMIRGEWVEVDHQALAKILPYLTEHKEEDLSLHDLLYLMADMETSSELDALPIVDFEVPENLHHLLSGTLQDVHEMYPTPTVLKGILRPYQERGYTWLKALTKMGFGVCLADDMGLGKTLQMITVLASEKLDQPALIVCPTSLLNNWDKEIDKFAPQLRVYTHHGPDRLHDKALEDKVKEHDVILTSYALLNRDADDLRRIKWSYLVLDEAQNIKNSKSKQAKSAMKTEATYRVAMTGTPIENRLSELWSIFQFLNPNYLGSLAHFRSHFTIPIERYQEQGRSEALRKLVYPFILRRLKTDPAIIADLPEKIESKTYCSLTKEQAVLYQRVVQEMMDKIQGATGMHRRGLVLATLTHLKQVCDHPVLYLHQQADQIEQRSGKVKRVTQLVQEIMEQEEAVLIFTQYVEMGRLLQQHLSTVCNEEVLFLHGGVTKQARDEMIDRFQTNSGPRIFILSLKAGGVGLNLTRANHVIHYDRWWNPAVENQATDRAYRIGQKKNVHVHRLICQGTLEERIDQIIESKKELAEQIIHSGEQWMTELSAGELQSIFALREDLLYQEEEELL